MECRKILEMSWTYRVSNGKVLQVVNKELEVLSTVKEKRNLQYLGNIIRNDKHDLLRLTMQGKIQGKRPPGRKRKSRLKNIWIWLT